MLGEEGERLVEADARDVNVQRSVEALRELVGRVPQNGNHAFICAKGTDMRSRRHRVLHTM